jgi:hypothetical protein
VRCFVPLSVLVLRGLSRLLERERYSALKADWQLDLPVVVELSSLSGPESSASASQRESHSEEELRAGFLEPYRHRRQMSELGILENRHLSQ